MPPPCVHELHLCWLGCAGIWQWHRHCYTTPNGLGVQFPSHRLHFKLPAACGLVSHPPSSLVPAVSIAADAAMARFRSCSCCHWACIFSKRSSKASTSASISCNGLFFPSCGCCCWPPPPTHPDGARTWLLASSTRGWYLLCSAGCSDRTWSSS